MDIETNLGVLENRTHAKLLLRQETEKAKVKLRKAAKDALIALHRNGSSKEAKKARVILKQAATIAEQIVEDAGITAEKLLTRVQVLEGIIPICCKCKRIRDDNNSWQRLERYIGEHSNACFSHGFCPVCATDEMEKFEAMTDIADEESKKHKKKE